MHYYNSQLRIIVDMHVSGFVSGFRSGGGGKIEIREDQVINNE